MKVHLDSLCRAALISGVLASISCGGGGSGYSNNNPPAGPGGGTSSSAAVITIGADGSISPTEVRIALRDRVQFVNRDSRPHQPQSNPHLQHTDCPALNDVGVLQPGESRTTATFDIEKACGFHDHMNPDTTQLRGTIRVAGAEAPPGPVYIKP